MSILDYIFSKLPDNSSKKIAAKDVRDSFQKMNERIDDAKSGIKGTATQSNAPTRYDPVNFPEDAERYPDGLFEIYQVRNPITSPNSWGSAVTQAELDANYVYFDVKNGVISKGVSLKPTVQLSQNLDTVNETEAVTGKAVGDYLDDIIIDGINLFDKATVLNGTYRSSTGLYADDPTLRAIPMMFLKAGQHTISGAQTIFFGNIYNSAVPSTESRISVIKTAGVVYESTYTFTIPNAVNGGAWVGLNITSAGAVNPNNTVNTYQIAKGTVTEFHEYTGKVVNAEKIVGNIPDMATAVELNSLDTKLNQIRTQSPNLLNKADIVSGSYYNFSAAAITANATWKRILVKVKPSTKYTISGVNSIFLGWELNTLQEPVIRISENTVVLSKKTFTTSATTEYLAINTDSDGGNSTNTAMLNEGEQLPYTNYGSKVEGIIVNEISDVYFSYNGSNTFTVFIRFNNFSNYYVGYKVSYFVDAVIRADLWRIAGADEYIFDGDVMNPTGVNIVTTAESEAVFMQLGKSDFTGGYHGDEKKTLVKFIANGVEITDLATAIPLTKIDRFEYVQKSNMLETDNDTENIIALHDKHTIFDANAGYKTFNRFTWKAAITVQIGFVSGISCIATTQANTVFSERFNVVTLNRNDTEKVNEVGAENMHFVGTNYGSVVKSKITKPSAYNGEALLRVYDISNYNKYYRSINNKTTTINEVWEGETIVINLKK